MSAIQLNNIEGWRPLGQVDRLDEYVQERGATEAAGTISQVGLPTDALTVDTNALSSRERLQARQGVAEYIGPLASGLEQSKPDGHKGLVICEELGSTALTDLFAGYSVSINELTGGRANALRLAGFVARQGVGFGLGYQIRLPNEGWVETFWQVVADGTYGFANMLCLPTPVANPLEGDGNIAFIPGAKEALTADVQTLIDLGRWS